MPDFLALAINSSNGDYNSMSMRQTTTQEDEATQSQKVRTPEMGRRITQDNFGPNQCVVIQPQSMDTNQ